MMDEATQQNAALVEQAAAAAESLVEQASALSTAISVFKLDNEPARLMATATKATSNSRSPAKLLSHKPAMVQPKIAAVKPVVKSGTDDSDWTEF
jgi:hypothetical protein